MQRLLAPTVLPWERIAGNMAFIAQRPQKREGAEKQ